MDDLSAALRDMWAQTLSVDPESVTAESDFFATGGSSLELGALITEVSERFGIEVSIAEFFMAPDFQGLVELCASAPPRPERDSNASSY